MSAYRDYPPAGPLLIGYDPDRDLPSKHLARLIDRVVEESVPVPSRKVGAGQPQLHPRLVLKVLVYAYCIGIRSSRQMERLCQESLPFLYLTRGAAPSHTTLCTARIECQTSLEAVFETLFAVAAQMGFSRMGRIVLDSTKLKANASPEAVLKRDEFAAVRAELTRILAEAAEVDAREDAEGATETILAKDVPSEEMRDILRRVRLQQAERNRREKKEKDQRDDSPPSGPEGKALQSSKPETRASPVVHRRMRRQIQKAIVAINEAESDGRKHLCVTDPDARMLGEGRTKQLKECHSFEVAVDTRRIGTIRDGLLVATSVTGEQDNSRLIPLVDLAKKQEPNGITHVDADSGYYGGSTVASLERQGIDTCIPNTQTACDIRRGLPVGTTTAKNQGKIPFTYDAERDCYRCPEKNALVFLQQRQSSGQQVRVYRAERDCRECPHAADCLTQENANRRMLKVGVDRELLTSVQKRFDTKEHLARYHQRAPAVETVFGFIRGTLGYTNWLLRGTAKVLCESRLFQAAYQFRKIHTRQTKKPPRGRRVVAPA